MTTRLPGQGREMRTGRDLRLREVEEPAEDVFSRGTHGQARTIATGANRQDNRATLIQIGGSHPRARAVTAYLCEPLDATTGLPLAQDVDLLARIRWGTNGVNCEAVVDFLRGARISVVGSWLQIDAEWVASGVAVPAGTPIRVGATAGYFGTGECSAQRTISSAAAVAAGATFVATIPPFAKSFQVITTPVNALGGYTIEYLDATGAVIGQESVPTAAFGTGPGPEVPNSTHASRGGFPIPSRATAVRFSNGGGASARDRVSFVFEVQL